MKLHLNCTWNNEKNRAKQIIHFDYAPKAIFGMPVEKIPLLQKLIKNIAIEGVSVLKDIEKLAEQFPKSLYILLNYYKALQFFKYLDEAKQVLTKIENKFPDEVFTKCLLGESFLLNKKYEAFPVVFNHIEVLKGAFIKRREFFFEEALFFHNLWGRYFFETGNEIQANKHRNLILFIMNMLQNYQMHSFTNSELLTDENKK